MKSPDVFAGFDFDVMKFIVSPTTRTISPKETGRMLMRIRQALADGDIAVLRQYRFIGRLNRPRSRRASIAPSLRRAVFEADGNRCVNCGATERLELDHVIPVVDGGSGERSNLQTLCRSCNRAKGPHSHATRHRYEGGL